MDEILQDEKEYKERVMKSREKTRLLREMIETFERDQEYDKKYGYRLPKIKRQYDVDMTQKINEKNTNQSSES